MVDTEPPPASVLLHTPPASLATCCAGLGRLPGIGSSRSRRLLDPASLASARCAGLAGSRVSDFRNWLARKSIPRPPDSCRFLSRVMFQFPVTDTTVFESHESLKLIWSSGEKQWFLDLPLI